LNRSNHFVSIVLLAAAIAASASAQTRRAAKLVSLTTDQLEYAPGMVAALTGSGFLPGESVAMHVSRADGQPLTADNHLPWYVTADEHGQIATSWTVCAGECVGQLLLATAHGAASGANSSSLFSNNNVCGTGVVQSVVGVGGSCVQFTPAMGMGPDNFEVEEGGTYVMTITGVTECMGDTITVFVQSSSTGNFCFDAVGGAGTYVGTFTMPDPACNTLPVSYKCGSGAACTNPGSFNVQGPHTGCGGVHLRASHFDGSCNKTGTDTDCAECILTTLDFETDACGDPTFMNHGLDLSTVGPECSFVCPLITVGPNNGNGNAGGAIFDTETSGGSQDPDLQAAPPGQGNVLICQNNNQAQTLAKTGINGPDTYNRPNDDEDGGTVRFDFCAPVDMRQIDLLDIDLPTPAQSSSVVLMDVSGFLRTYTVNAGWTPDGGVTTLDLQGGNQVGPGGATATVSTQVGYDPLQVIRVTVTFGSSGALDNLVWCPPATFRAAAPTVPTFQQTLR
jgi:hypothetical protein